MERNPIGTHNIFNIHVSLLVTTFFVPPRESLRLLASPSTSRDL